MTRERSSRHHVVEAYVHDIPGRLRIRSSVIKGSALQGAAVKDLVAALPGVQSAEVNTLTGSLTVRYDVRAASGPAILALLQERGFVGAVARNAATPPAPVMSSGELSGKVAKAVGSFLLEKAVERSVVALVAAVL